MGNTISFRKEFGLILVGAIVFTASFLWKDLISDIQEYYFPKNFGLKGRALYVFVVTTILIIAAINLRYTFGLANGQDKRNPIQFDDGPIDDTIADDSSIGGDIGGGAEGFRNLINNNYF